MCLYSENQFLHLHVTLYVPVFGQSVLTFTCHSVCACIRTISSYIYMSLCMCLYSENQFLHLHVSLNVPVFGQSVLTFTCNSIYACIRTSSSYVYMSLCMCLYSDNQFLRLHVLCMCLYSDNQFLHLHVTLYVPVFGQSVLTFTCLSVCACIRTISSYIYM